MEAGTLTVIGLLENLPGPPLSSTPLPAPSLQTRQIAWRTLMEVRSLADTVLLSSRLVLGTMTLGSQFDQSTATAMVARSMDAEDEAITKQPSVCQRAH